MNFKKLRKKLKKLTFLLDSLEGESTISMGEQSLLKSYLREAYQEVEELELDGEDRAPAIMPAAVIKAVQVSEPSVLDIEEDDLKNDIPEILETVDVEMENHKMNATSAPTSTINVAPAPTQNSSANHTDEEGPEIADLDALFDEIPVTELSDKLSMQPVKDLSKSMGINEKIFTITELFGGNNEAYKQTINGLNGFHSFLEAKHFLKNGAATQYNWSEPNRLKKAANFIKLIRRRYV